MPIYKLKLKGLKLPKTVDAPTEKALLLFIENNDLRQFLSEAPEVCSPEIADMNEDAIFIEDSGIPLSGRDECDFKFWKTESLVACYPPHNWYELTYTNDFHVTMNEFYFDHKPSLAVMNHSQDGFSWSYNGSGPAQLALAILLNETGSKQIALNLYHDFKSFLLANIPRNVNGFRIRSDDVRQYVELRQNKADFDTMKEWRNTILSQLK